MSTRTLAILASVLTALLLLLLGAILLFGLIVALNGFGEGEGAPALLTSLLCQGATVIVAAILAGRLTRWLVEKRHWPGIVSVIASVFAGAALFVGAGLASIFFAAIVAETLRR